MGPAYERMGLREWPLAARLVVAVFLISVGLGYLSALVQLHFQQASPGKPLPGPEEVQDAYHGRAGMGQFERLIVTDENKPFNGSGSMRAAFTVRSPGGKARWEKTIKEIAADLKISVPEAEKVLRKERETEINALLAWLHGGATKDGYDAFPLPDDFLKDYPKGRDPNEDFFAKNAEGKLTAKVSKIIDTRCARCHNPGKSDAAGEIHLDSYENVMTYVPADPTAAAGGMSLTKLAQSTHVHLLGFSMLYLLTGLIFSLTSYPGLIRAIVGPFPLIMQMADISCWWLARIDPFFAQCIIATGGLVATGLMLQIVLSLFNMFGAKGKLVVFALLIGGVIGLSGLYAKVIRPQLQREETAAHQASIAK